MEVIGPQNQPLITRAIAEYFPGRTPASLGGNYPVYKAKAETFDAEDVFPNLINFKTRQAEKLKAAVEEDEKGKWKRVAGIMGKSAGGCKTKAKEMGFQEAQCSWH